MNERMNLRVYRRAIQHFDRYSAGYTWLTALQSGVAMTLETGAGTPFEHVDLARAAWRIARRCRVAHQPLVEHTRSVPAQEVCIATLYNKAIERLGRRTERINTRYARRHGYAFRAYHGRLDKTRDITWSKVKFVRQLLDEFRYVVWVDADAVFIDQRWSLEHVLCHLHDRDMVVSLESPALGGLINSGFFAAGPGGKRVLDEIYSAGARRSERWPARPNDQTGFYLWLYRSEAPEVMGLLDSDQCNSHPVEYRRRHQRPWPLGGPVVVHAAAMPIDRKIAFIRRHVPAALRRPGPDVDVGW